MRRQQSFLAVFAAVGIPFFVAVEWIQALREQRRVKRSGGAE